MRQIRAECDGGSGGVFMSLEQQIEAARKEIISDGYDMSVGEVMNLYKDRELRINPAFQQLFRWDISQKSRFIESLLLGIPIPPIFVVQDEDGVWELIDGLQRLSTILEFAGVLRHKNTQELMEPSVLEGTKFLPDLSGKTWDAANCPDAHNLANNGIGKAQQLLLKRARLRVEILRNRSDKNAKYELFQRLNTGGSKFSPQEVRNCVGMMINPDFQQWIVDLSNTASFLICTAQTPDALEQQQGVELALRFIAFRTIKYDRSFDIHEYLDHALIVMAQLKDFDRGIEADVFARTFALVETALGGNAFKRWSGSAFTGQFTMAAFEVVATGVAANLEDLEALNEPSRSAFILQKVQQMWDEPHFQANSGAGVRGTTRLASLLNMGPDYFAVNG